MTLAARTAALAAIVRTNLQAHDAAFIVAERVQLDAHLDTQVQRRRTVMGDPVRYAEVVPVGLENDPLPWIVDTDNGARWRYQIMVRYQYADTDQNAGDWDAILFGSSPDGLLRQFMCPDETTVYASRPQNTEMFVTDLDITQNIFIHECRFEVVTPEG